MPFLLERTSLRYSLVSTSPLCSRNSHLAPDGFSAKKKSASEAFRGVGGVSDHWMWLSESERGGREMGTSAYDASYGEQLWGLDLHTITSLGRLENHRLGA